MLSVAQIHLVFQKKIQKKPFFILKPRHSFSKPTERIIMTLGKENLNKILIQQKIKGTKNKVEIEKRQIPLC